MMIVKAPEGIELGAGLDNKYLRVNCSNVLFLDLSTHSGLSNQLYPKRSFMYLCVGQKEPKIIRRPFTLTCWVNSLTLVIQLIFWQICSCIGSVEYHFPTGPKHSPSPTNSVGPRFTSPSSEETVKHCIVIFQNHAHYELKSRNGFRYSLIIVPTIIIDAKALDEASSNQFSLLGTAAIPRGNISTNNWNSL